MCVPTCIFQVISEMGRQCATLLSPTWRAFAQQVAQSAHSPQDDMMGS